MTQNNAQDPGEQFERNFLKAAALSLDIYRQQRERGENAARSNKKLFPLHGCIARFVRRSLGVEYEIKSFDIGDDKEQKVSGSYYEKTVDIAVLKAQQPRAIASFKFAMSKYSPNSVNYFEHMLGESANLRLSDCVYAHVLLILRNRPSNLLANAEMSQKITGHNLMKYIRLNQRQDYPHRPDLLTIAIVDYDGESAVLCESDMGFSSDVVSSLQGDFSLRNFARKFPNLCKLKE